MVEDKKYYLRIANFKLNHRPIIFRTSLPWLRTESTITMLVLNVELFLWICGFMELLNQVIISPPITNKSTTSNDNPTIQKIRVAKE